MLKVQLKVIFSHLQNAYYDLMFKLP